MISIIRIIKKIFIGIKMTVKSLGEVVKVIIFPFSPAVLNI